MRKSKAVALHYDEMGVANATSYIIQRMYKRKTLLSATIKNTELHISLRNDSYDTQVFTQIFLRHELDIHFDKTPEIIIDGGANIGLATLYLKNKFPDATIIAIEPERSNFDLLVRNTRPYKNVICLNNAIWNRRCRLQIVDNGSGNASFTTKEVSEGEPISSVVDAITITDVMNQFQLHRLDLVKLDIEGSEKQVFESNYEEWLSKTTYVVVEIHRHLQSECEETVMGAFGSAFVCSRSGEYSFFRRNLPESE